MLVMKEGVIYEIFLCQEFVVQGPILRSYKLV